MTDIDARLRDDVHLLGELLGNTIRDQYGEAFLAKIERIRQGAKADRRGTTGEELSAILDALGDDEVLPVARAFNQFLNLANIAEQYELIHRREEGQPQPFEALVLPQLLARLLAEGHDPESLARQVSRLEIELVLTAHPTEVTRRTLIQKYDAIAEQLAAQDHRDLTLAEKSEIHQRLQRLIAEAWHTEEIRRTRPTPVDEAKWGFAVIEHSLWHAVPHMLRKADKALHAATGLHLPLEAAPVRFASWMGGDRDGNPNVTASVTREVLLLARWMAADLYLRDIDKLAADLSMQQASAQLLAAAGDSAEPYRAVLKQLRERLRATRNWAHTALHSTQAAPPEVLQDNRELLAPLQLCYQSLHACGMGVIADGPLLDFLRRAVTFGLFLVRLDVRQDAARHASAMTEITDYLGLGRYEDWDEDARLSFLMRELNNRRPLLPGYFKPGADTAEVLATCRNWPNGQRISGPTIRSRRPSARPTPASKPWRWPAPPASRWVMPCASTRWILPAAWCRPRYRLRYLPSTVRAGSSVTPEPLHEAYFVIGRGHRSAGHRPHPGPATCLQPGRGWPGAHGPDLQGTGGRLWRR